MLYVPLTTQNRRSRYEVPIPRLPFLHQDSVANVQGLGSLPLARSERRIGLLPDREMHSLRMALAFALGLADGSDSLQNQ